MCAVERSIDGTTNCVEGSGGAVGEGDTCEGSRTVRRAVFDVEVDGASTIYGSAVRESGGMFKRDPRELCRNIEIECTTSVI